MAQFNFEERIDTYEIESTNVMTGDRDRSRYLYYQLKMSMAKAKQIDIIVSFLMESGVRMLLNDMKRALERGVKIRILTGNYLGITQPSALYLIKSELGDRVDLRLYNETSRSFHPKSYIFHYESSNEIYIGSSNISKSALTSGIEWNYRFSDTLDKKNYELFYATFEDLFLNHSIIIDDEELKRYSKAWKKPAVSRDLAKYDTAEDNEDRNTENVRMLYRPRGAQIEALYALQESRMEGATKGLVYAATGIGKTYLAAFDSAKYERVLFVAHREEILKQAAVSFKNVRNSEDYGFFDGKEKDRDKSVIFASVATLGRTEYLNETYFPADYFDYVIIDEFHHAVTDQYRRIVEYFQPQFLLGLTATPERMDGKNIYEICDYSVRLIKAKKEAKKIDFIIDIDENDVCTMHIGEFQTILINLLDNACYWLRNAKNKKIKISAKLSSNNKNMEIVVSDNGPGIIEEEKQKIFQPGVTAKPQGIGMGLVIVTELLNNHNCKIRLETPGEYGGATFAFEVPME